MLKRSGAVLVENGFTSWKEIAYVPMRKLAIVTA